METIVTESLLLVGCVAAAVFAFYCAKQAVNAALELEKSRAKIDANEAAVGNLNAQHLKLRGAFYQFRWRIEQQDAGEPDETDPAMTEVCENWTRAQLEGPYSEAARCDCGYCEEMRARRRAPQPVVLSGRKPS